MRYFNACYCDHIQPYIIIIIITVLLYTTRIAKISVVFSLYRKMVGSYILNAELCLFGFSEVNSTCYSPQNLPISAREN